MKGFLWKTGKRMLNNILEICGTIGIIGGAVAVIWKFISPQIKRGNDIEKNKEAIARLQRHEQNDFEALHEIRKIEREQCRVMIAILNHMIDVNGAEKMKSTRRELEKLITDIDN